MVKTKLTIIFTKTFVYRISDVFPKHCHFKFRECIERMVLGFCQYVLDWQLCKSPCRKKIHN